MAHDGGGYARAPKHRRSHRSYGPTGHGVGTRGNTPRRSRPKVRTPIRQAPKNLRPHHRRRPRTYSTKAAHHLLRSVGAKPREARKLSGVVQPESRGNPRAINAIGAAGLFQIYEGHYPSPARKQFLFNPRNNAKEALKKYRAAGGRAPWIESRPGWRTSYRMKFPKPRET